jgi:hypothetical protein
MLTMEGPGFSNRHRQVEKSKAWIDRFCKNYRGKTIIMVTEGIGGDEAEDFIEYNAQKAKEAKKIDGNGDRERRDSKA